MTKELGATHAINSKQTNPVEAIRDITGGGVDYSLETSGNPRVLHQAIEALGSLGTCGIVGAQPLGTEVSFDVNNLMLPGKAIRGILEGESVPDIFIPQLIELNAQGRFPFEKLMKFTASIKSIKLRKTVKEEAQSSPLFAYQRRARRSWLLFNHTLKIS